MSTDWAWDDHIPSGVHGIDGYDSVSCSCGWDSETSKDDWVQHVRAMGADSLDAAWAEAEAALPDGWFIARLELLRLPTRDRPLWQVLTSRPMTSGSGAMASGEGPTPAAALRALAAKLRGALAGGQCPLRVLDGLPRPDAR